MNDPKDQKSLDEVVKKLTELASFFNTTEQDNVEMSRLQTISNILLNYPVN